MKTITLNKEYSDITYIVIPVDKDGNPVFTSHPVFQMNDITEDQIEEATKKLSTVVEACKIVQPNQNVGVFSVQKVE